MPHPNYPTSGACIQGALREYRGERDFAAAVAQQPEQMKRAPQVPEAIGRMSACIDDLGSAMNALAARIDPVLRPADHTGAAQGAAVPAPVRSHTAIQIDDQCDRLCFITGNLRDILDRLEV